MVAASAALIIGAAAPGLAQDSLTLINIAAAGVNYNFDAVPSPTRTEARMVYSAPPEWPLYEKSANVDGAVVVEIDLDATGQLTSAAVLASSGRPRFDRSALDAVRASTYKAASINGRAVGGRYIVEAVFDPSI
jgi:TonB family protein